MRIEKRCICTEKGFDERFLYISFLVLKTGAIDLNAEFRFKYPSDEFSFMKFLKEKYNITCFLPYRTNCLNTYGVETNFRVVHRNKRWYLYNVNNKICESGTKRDLMLLISNYFNYLFYYK